MRKIVLLPIMLPLMIGCAQMDKPRPGSEQVPASEWDQVRQDHELWAEQERHLREHRERIEAEEAAQQLDARARMPSALLTTSPDTDGKRYSFSAENLPLRTALRMFARTHNLNILPDPDVNGEITVDFNDLPLRRAMEMLLSSHDYLWEWDENVIRVRNVITRNYTLDYVLLNRSSSSSASAGVSSQGGGEGSSSASISQSTNIDFWGDIEQQLRQILSSDGRIVINRMTGSIQVTDAYRNIKNVEWMLDSLKDSMHRQVEIEARIVEVTLRDDMKLGIDWSRINLGRDNNLSLRVMSESMNPDVRGANAQTGISVSLVGNRFSGIINALQEQGDVRVVSQPRIRTLNNQQALIKVGTDEVFWNRAVSRIITDGITDTEVTYTQQTVTEGLMLSVTPQISADGWVMLDVAPIITRISGVSTSPDNENNAPIIDIKQTSTLVRALDGEMVLIGGLIQDGTSDRSTQVPGLGDIPLFGKAFRGQNQGRERTELVIFLTPKVVGGSGSLPRR